ncbi:hypothetical protein [Candidatus Roseilinea sp. NK_OTU-006]|jgi:hypothetical protein|uniref:hypothetical protein n=1 Tax=Candidatus Roseilinea sp. NK_OTU-006 TaxID=2704250 RepID=UPI00145FB5E2|nr:hypothetical protein [Candidatus Roseilinea sp. NK_OTU-006]
MTTHRDETDQGEAALLIEVTPATIQDESAPASREWPTERGITSSVVRKATDKAMDAAFETIEHIAQRTA